MSKFGIVPSALFDVPGIGPDEISVFALLSTYADRDGWCWPATRTLAGRLNRSQPWVVAALRKLRERRVILTENRPGALTRYRLLFDRHWADIRDADQRADHPDQPIDRSDQRADRTDQPADTEHYQEHNQGNSLARERPEPISGVSRETAWALSPELAEWCRTRHPRLDPQHEASQFWNWHVAHDRIPAEPNAAFKVWCGRSASDFAPKANGRGAPPPDGDERRARIVRAAARASDQADVG